MIIATFTVDRPPSVNQLYRNVAGRGRVKTARYQQWLKTASWELKEYYDGHAFTGPVKVKIWAGRTITKVGKWSRRDGDIDNLAKPIMDLLVQNEIIPDDSAEYVHTIELAWVTTVDPGLVCIVISEVETA